MVGQTRRSILNILLLVRGVIGFTVGLYLYNYGAVIYDGLSSTLSQPDTTLSLFKFNMYPLQWTAFIFSFGILAEALLEIPTGVFADSLGRKFATVISFLFRVAYFICLVLIWWCGTHQLAQEVLVCGLVAVLLFAFHYTFMSGSFLAWLKDALDEIDQSELLNDFLAKGQLCYQINFLLGTATGLFLWLQGFVQWAYFAGALLNLVAAMVCLFRMQENLSYDFVQTRDLYGRSFKKVWSEIYRIWVAGGRYFVKHKNLWVVFGAIASVYSMTYLVDFVWPVFTRAIFTKELGTGFSPEWVALLLIFSTSSLIGTFVFSFTVKKYIKKRRRLGLHDLTLLNALSFFLFAVPIFAVVFLDTGLLGANLNLWAFMVLMVWHKSIQGFWLPSTEGLQSEMIPKATRERSTILSLGAMVKNVLIVLLVFFGIGKSTQNLIPWLVPATVIVVMTLLLLMIKSGRTSESKDQKKEAQV